MPVSYISFLPIVYKGGTKGISSRKSHYNDRTVCLNKFAQMYFNGSLPLRYAHTKIVNYVPT